RSLAVRLLGTKLKPVENKLAKRSFRNVLIVRLFPVGSNLITNAVAGVLSVPFFPFIAASAIGFAPQTFLFTLLGSGSRFVSSLEQPLQIGGLIISLLLLLSLSGIARRSEPS
ncbi:MAG TPA: DedA family protein, partial [Alteromonas macleodii]|nr:DedA family protein [Alteromonas macleodii]